LLNRHLQASLSMTRVGDTVSLSFDGLLVASDSSSAFAGPATFFFVFSNNNDGGTASAVWTDFNVTSGVPEPSTWVMIILGFAGVGFAAHRRRNKTVLSAA
jgi:hypothetical protein